MTLYVDTSALLKRYFDEPDSARFNDLLASDTRWLTCRLTWVEAWRNLGRRLDRDGTADIRAPFRADWEHLAVIEIDATLCEEAGMV